MTSAILEVQCCNVDLSCAIRPGTLFTPALRLTVFHDHVLNLTEEPFPMFSEKHTLYSRLY